MVILGSLDSSCVYKCISIHVGQRLLKGEGWSSIVEDLCGMTKALALIPSSENGEGRRGKEERMEGEKELRRKRRKEMTRAPGSN